MPSLLRLGSIPPTTQAWILRILENTLGNILIAYLLIKTFFALPSFGFMMTMPLEGRDCFMPLIV